MPAATKNFEVAIVGGGLAGVGLAHALHQRGVPVQVYEKNQKFDEFGAGLTFQPTAVAALKFMSPDVYGAFAESTQPSKDGLSFMICNGMKNDMSEAFPVHHTSEMGGVHRSHFLDNMAKRLSADIPVHFSKNIDNITTDPETGKQKMAFADGSSALADLVIGADGIGSHVRRIMFGKDHPCVRAKYSGSYMYRAVVPMETVVGVMGKEKAHTPTTYAGDHGEVILYPLEGNTLVTVAAMYEDNKPWPDPHHTLRQAKRADMERDFASWNSAIRAVISACPEDITAWGLFDTADDLVPTYVDGRTVLLGDAAHATCPTMASGAGVAMEDAAILADLLGQDSIREPADLDAALATFNEVRVPRGRYLVQGSRAAQLIWGMRAPGIGADMRKIEVAIKAVVMPAWEADFAKMAEHARGVLSIKQLLGI